VPKWDKTLAMHIYSVESHIEVRERDGLRV
jgi:hypothetical protein